MNRLAISPDKRFLAAAGNGTVKLYDIATSASASANTNVGPVRHPLLAHAGYHGLHTLDVMDESSSWQ